MKLTHRRDVAIISSLLLGLLCSVTGCGGKQPSYGVESTLFLPGSVRQVWAIAPATNLSGQADVDPLLQSDYLFNQLQQVEGLTVVPVNRVAEVYAALRIKQVQSDEQAARVCELLGVDALVVPTVTAYDPYNPPKMGVSLQLFMRPGLRGERWNVDPRALSRQASGGDELVMHRDANFLQAVGMFDAANGSTRDALMRYAHGRNDPLGPLGSKEYLVAMDRYSGFVYHCLIRDLLGQMSRQR